MATDIKQLLKEATKDLLTAETLTAIEEAVNTKADEKARLQVEAALVAQDEKHSQMLTSLMEKMDTDYTNKLQKLINRVDESYAAKLLKVKGIYDAKVSKLNTQLNESAEKYINTLNSRIDTFLESKLNEIVPEIKLNEAVENVRAVKILEQIRSLVGINESDVSSEVKAAMIDGKKQIDESKSQLDAVIRENTELKQKITQKEADLLLERKTVKLPLKKRNYVKKAFEGKDAAFINENFDYVSKMFDSEEVVETNKARSSASKVADKVDTNMVITESKKSEYFSNPMMEEYLKGL
ncbi:MAG: hypothetical protein LC127_17445 [Chitinophagales bacterium]|nr:hypothetical protein [Chitinophagales bacterium]